MSNINTALKFLKSKNFWTCAFDQISKTNFTQHDWEGNFVLLFGSEGSGLRNIIKKECDALVSIPMKTDEEYNIDSLNVSNACSIALYEHFKNNIK